MTEQKKMTEQEVVTILQNSNSSEWIHNEEKGSYVYRNDLLLRIQERPIDLEHTFDEPWATRHEDKHAYKVVYDVYYMDSLIKSVTLVSVDGFRATIPMPKERNSTEISAEEYAFAKIVSPARLEEYIQRSGLSFEKCN